MINYSVLPSRIKISSAARIYSSVCLLILVLSAIVAVAWVNAGQDANKDAMQRITNDLQDHHATFDQETRDLENLSKWLASRSDFRNMVQLQDKAGLAKELMPLVKQSVIESVVVMDAQGGTLSQLSRNRANSLDPQTLEAEWLTEAAKEQGTSALALQPSGDLEIAYILPVSDSKADSLLGYLVIGYSLNERFVKPVTNTQGQQALVLSNFRVSASSLQDDGGNPLVGRQLAIRQGSSGKDVSFASINANGETFLFGVQAVALTSGGSVLQYAIGIPKREITQAAWLSFQGIGIPLAAAVLGLIIASILWRKRLSEVNQELAIATLRLNEITPVPLGSSVDESERKEEQKRFWLNVAHELRSPLTSMRTSIDLLLEDYSELESGEAEAMLQRLQGSAFRFQNLVENLLDYESLQTGRFIMRPKPVELSIIIDEAVAQVYPLLQARNQELVVRLERKHSVVLADQHRVEEVIVNLLCNASKYSPSNKTIVLSTCRDAGRVFVGVTDHGDGIPAEEQTAIFQPFYRVQQTVGDVVGMGLGLALAKENVEQHGGRIGVNSCPGGPTTFWFSLPEHEIDDSPATEKENCNDYENYAGR